MKKTYTILGIIFLFTLLPITPAIGQPPPPPPQPIPIDGGLLFLLFSGIGLVVKNFISKNKEKKQ